MGRDRRKQVKAKLRKAQPRMGVASKDAAVPVLLSEPELEPDASAPQLEETVSGARTMSTEASGPQSKNFMSPIALQSRQTRRNVGGT